MVFRTYKAPIRAAIFFGLAIIASSPCFAAALPAQTYDVETIIQLSVTRNTANFRAIPQFDYFKIERGDDGRNRTYEEIMLLGSRYSRLVAIDGVPLSAVQARDEQKRLDAARRNRRNESAAERSKRVSGYERERQRDQFLLNEMVHAFDFALQGEEQIGPHAVYKLKATPHRGYRPPDNRAKVLTGMEGILWIDKQTFQWVKVEAWVTHPVNIEGFLARVERGTRFQLEQIPITDNLWFPGRFSMKARARILFLFSHNSDEDESYYDYRPNAAQP